MLRQNRKFFQWVLLKWEAKFFICFIGIKIDVCIFFFFWGGGGGGVLIDFAFYPSFIFVFCPFCPSGYPWSLWFSFGNFNSLGKVQDSRTQHLKTTEKSCAVLKLLFALRNCSEDTPSAPRISVPENKLQFKCLTTCACRELSLKKVNMYITACKAISQVQHSIKHEWTNF